MRYFWQVAITLLMVVLIFLQVYTITHFAEVKALVTLHSSQVEEGK